jgi:hypothetical protein
MGLQLVKLSALNKQPEAVGSRKHSTTTIFPARKPNARQSAMAGSLAVMLWQQRLR